MIKKILFPAICTFIFFYSCRDDPSSDESRLYGLLIEKCLIPTHSKTFDIMTWNIKEFPVQGEKTLTLLAEIIKMENPDLIALQEITSENDFESLISKMPGWKGILLDSSDLNPAFLYKSSEVNLIGRPVVLFSGEEEAFPRPPLMISVEHLSGVELFLINVHLKCCSGEGNEIRRREASRLLKSYLDEKLSQQKVMILGDFNDEISSSDSVENVFFNFLRDSLNYKFVDQDIARGDPAYWSYPSWPSHIDHILISNELFTKDLTTGTIRFDQCDSAYFAYISDHRPVIVRFQ